MAFGIADFANIALGAFGLVQGRKAYGEAARVAEEALDLAREEAGYKRELLDLEKASVADVQRTRGQLSELARATLGTIHEESYGRALGLYDAILQGKMPEQLAAFQPQFNEIDFAMNEELRGVDLAARKAQRMVSDSVPEGGARTRLLASIAMNAQDKKAQTIGLAKQKRRDLNIQLQNQYFQEAMTFGKAQPEGYTKAASILSALPTVSYGAASNLVRGLGPEGGTQLPAAMQAMETQAQSGAALSRILGNIAEREHKAREPEITPISKDVVPSSQLLAPSTYKGRNLWGVQ